MWTHRLKGLWIIGRRSSVQPSLASCHKTLNPPNAIASSRRICLLGGRRRRRSRKMSKKNKLSTRVKQHIFDLKREKEDQEKKAKKAEKKKAKVESSMKVDSGKVGKVGKVGKQIKKKSFKVGKKRMQLSATTKAKAAQAIAMEIEK